jgi:hypothetical protein
MELQARARGYDEDAEVIQRLLRDAPIEYEATDSEQGIS